MKDLQFDYRMQLQFSDPVTRHHYALRCLPMQTARQRPRALVCDIAPDGRRHKIWDSFGNRVLCGYVEASHDQFAFRVKGVVTVEDSRYETDGYHELYRAATALTNNGAALAQLAQDAGEGPWDLAERSLFYMHAVYRHFTYAPGATTVHTTAEQAAALGKGVCQDYAHTLLALLRREGIAARYIAGLLEGEGATHAWIEVWTGYYWLPLDPTHDCACDDRYIKLTQGRDFVDCSIDRGAFYGVADQSQSVFARVTALEPVNNTDRMDNAAPSVAK